MRFTSLFRSITALTVILLGFSVSARAMTDMDYVEQPWSFNIGGGYSPVVGGLNDKLTSGWNFSVGTGYNFNQKAGVVLEYMNNHLGVEDGELSRFSQRLGGAETEGRVNVWSLTVNPTWRFHINHRIGAYLIGGGGYYHVNAQVTTPGVAYQPPYCDYYWGCWPGGFVGVDSIVAEHKDDTGGVNVGGGFTFLLGNNGVKFFVESRYHYILTKGPDLTLLPFTAGFRF